MSRKPRSYDNEPDEFLLFIYHLPRRPYTKHEVVTALRRYFEPFSGGKIIPYEWALQDPNDKGTPTEIMLKMKDPTLIDEICQNPIHVIEIGGSPSTDVPPTKHLIGVSKVSRSRTLIVTPKFPHNLKHSDKREKLYNNHGAHAEVISGMRLTLDNQPSFFVVFPTRSAARTALPALRKKNTVFFCDKTICHSWFRVVGTLSNLSIPPSPDRIDVLNDIAQNIRSFFISKMHATHVLFDLSETSPLSSFEVHFPETARGEQQAIATVACHSMQFSPYPSASPRVRHSILEYSLEHTSSFQTTCWFSSLYIHLSLKALH
ncbi:hypothetical protein BLNAU_21209 [Blattamonas nauphoetae]|uniref:Uncharacterized protein n=1 Tax=Blattamonas nauphoetae TaxID=2049346 RepID=A0ABQ9WWH8_9EUKA|nr:hypothetical protein BLNAU_21209 [Blattamonas nauphoetae]